VWGKQIVFLQGLAIGGEQGVLVLRDLTHV
jgi:hypothetical protein